MSTSKKTANENNFWIIGSIFSLVLLIIFLYLQERDLKMLELDVKWLVVAGIPLILAILSSNIIKKFKGFGIELETRLQEPISNIKLTAVDALLGLPSDEKQSIEYLRNLSDTKRFSIQRLSFHSGRRGYYTPEAIGIYIRELPNLKYFEIVNKEGKFNSILPVELFKVENYIATDRLNRFYKALLEDTVDDYFKGSVVTETIADEEDLLESLPKVRKSRFGYLPVVTSDGYLIGVVTPNAIESKIADQVIAIYKKE